MNPPTNVTDFPQAARITLGGVELEVYEAGRENLGKPIVLCHGWPDLAFTWRHQVPALVAAGYHVIAPNQRGYGNSSHPVEVTDYDIAHLTGDLVALLDHYGYGQATFIGHDWGAMVVWSLAQLHPTRVSRLICLSLPYLARGETPWLDVMEAVLGAEYYFVHFNRQPGVADAVFAANTPRFLRNLYSRTEPASMPPGMLELAHATTPAGEPLMGDDDLAVYVSTFERTGFTGGINWYRNLDRDWHLLGEVDPVIRHDALMIYGDRDTVAQADYLAEYVPKVEEVHLDAGHWIQQELPDETNRTIVEWLARTDAGSPGQG